MHHGFENELKEAMNGAFEKVVGYPAKIKAKTSAILERQPTLKSNDLEEVLRSLNEFKGYYSRGDV